MKKAILLLFAFALFGCEQSVETQSMPEQLSGTAETGTVLETIAVDAYTYLRLDVGGNEVWIASNPVWVSEGDVVRFADGKVPQIGWNLVRSSCPDICGDGYAYFVNSYYPVPKDSSATLYTTDYHGDFCSGVVKDNLTAYQFHPEKSGEFGHDLLRRWISCCANV